jgi:hypothetical protein
VNAPEITDAVQVVGPPRWSETVTTPREPVIVLALVEATCDPNDTAPVGALIESAPAVRVNVAVVPALTGIAVAAANVAKLHARTHKLVVRAYFVRFMRHLSAGSPKKKSAASTDFSLIVPRGGSPRSGEEVSIDAEEVPTLVLKLCEVVEPFGCLVF